MSSFFILIDVELQFLKLILTSKLKHNRFMGIVEHTREGMS